MLNGVSKNGLLLAGFTLITTVILSTVFWLTEPRIKTQIQQRTKELLSQVLPEVEYDNDLIASCTLVNNDAIASNTRVYRATLNDSPVALILDTVTPSGYNGDIRYLVSLMATGEIGGVRVLEHNETPGLGDKIELRIDDWILSFSGIKAQDVYENIWAVKKDGGQFDQFTGATITPRAIVSGLKDALSYALEHQEALYKAKSTCVQEQA